MRERLSQQYPIVPINPSVRKCPTGFDLSIFLSRTSRHMASPPFFSKFFEGVLRGNFLERKFPLSASLFLAKILFHYRSHCVGCVVAVDAFLDYAGDHYGG